MEVQRLMAGWQEGQAGAQVSQLHCFSEPYCIWSLGIAAANTKPAIKKQSLFQFCFVFGSVMVRV